MPRRPALKEPDYASLADFRYTLKRFLQFSSEAARAAGLSPPQHQALLAIKGTPADASLTIGELAERLQVRHHSAVGLVDRLAQRQLVKRTPSAEDRRKVNLSLTAKGESLIGRLSAAHQEELKAIGPQLQRIIDAIAKK